MTEVLPEVKAAAAALAQLDETERERGIAQVKHLATTQAPLEEIAKPPIRNMGEYLAAQIPDPPAIIQPGLVVRGAVTIMTSRGGKGKTTFSLNRQLAWATGQPVFDGIPEVMAPVKPTKTLIIENEGAAGFFQSRLRKMVEGKHYTNEQLALANENMLIWGDGGWSSLKIDDENNMDLIRRGIEEYEPDVVFLEPMRGLHKGEENSNTEMGNLMDSLNGLASDYSIGVMITHHELKSGPGDGDEMNAVRGAGAFTDLAAVVERWRHVKGGQLSEIKWTKSRFGLTPLPIRMKFEPVIWGYTYVPEDEDNKAVLAVLYDAPGEHFSVADVADILSETKQHVQTVLDRLRKEEKVKRVRGFQMPGEAGSAGYRYHVVGDIDGGGLAL